jgi:hypothetical protein
MAETVTSSHILDLPWGEPTSMAARLPAGIRHPCMVALFEPFGASRFSPLLKGLCATVVPTVDIKRLALALVFQLLFGRVRAMEWIVWRSGSGLMAVFSTGH